MLIIYTAFGFFDLFFIVLRKIINRVKYVFFNRFKIKILYRYFIRNQNMKSKISNEQRRICRKVF